MSIYLQGKYLRLNFVHLKLVFYIRYVEPIYAASQGW
jgi:hypothetical protein